MCKILTFDFLENKKLWKYKKKAFFLVLQVLFFRHKKWTSKNEADTPLNTSINGITWKSCTFELRFVMKNGSSIYINFILNLQQINNQVLILGSLGQGIAFVENIAQLY